MTDCAVLATEIATWAQALLASATPGQAIALGHLIDRIGKAQPGFLPVPQVNAALRDFMAAALIDDAPLTSALVTVWPKLAWRYHYKPRPDAPDLADRIAFTELLGPEAALRAPGIRAGFTFMAPGTLYPAHAHPAEELYIVLSGRALWTQSGRATWQDRGALILHAPEEVHVMQSFDAPLLALWSWRGEIEEPAQYL